MKHQSHNKPTQDAPPMDPDQSTEENAPVSALPIDSTPSRPTNQVSVICTSLYVRTAPSKKAEVLFQVKKDDILTKLEDADTPDDWIKMTLNGKTGWVMKEFTEEV